jgi:competence/damage-inducible protein CinA-like protein
MSINLAILTIGDELLNGDIADTNTPAMARLLGDHGYRVRERLSVGDSEAAIAEALQALTARHAVVLVSGGLGSTVDDRTARGAARAFGRRLVLNDEALAQIRAHFARQRSTMHPRDEKQALLPHQAVILPNHRGSAPGFLIRERGAAAFFLPGVPAEMISMLRKAVLPWLEEEHPGEAPQRQRVLRLFGVTEPQCEERLASAGLPAGIEVAFAVDFPEVLLKLRANGEDADHLLDRAEVAVRRACDEFLLATGEETLAGNLARLLTNAGLTLALAESCTGGLIAKLLTDIPGSSAFFQRGAVTYANRAKQEWLDVPEAILAGPGAVSADCALAMARGMRRAAGSDLALAVTGIAGPEGGTPEKPVGTVFIALASAEETTVQGYRFPGDRQAVRTLTAFTALAWLRRHLVTPSSA